MKQQVSADFQKMVHGYGLTTLHVVFYRLDFPSLLQDFTYQQYDLWPEFPRMMNVIGCIQAKTRVRKVIIAHSKLIKPAELRTINGEFRLH